MSKPEEKKKFLKLEKEMKKEMDNNWQSNFIANRGKPILYGDSILLFHIQRFVFCLFFFF